VASIHIEEVTKRFGTITAVDGMRLDLQEGELVAFLGPSGCGKTTTLRMVAGFERPTAGAIRVGEQDVTNLAPEHRNVGMVFQSYALFPHMTVGENVAYGLQMRKVAPAEVRSRVEAMLTKVQLNGLDDRFPHQSSGGQQQRTALARALVINPAVLLLDEPLANLDAKLREEMRFFIKELQREFGITTIYVTHDQSEALVLADRIAVMMDGVIHQVGGPKEIYEQPATARVAAFIGLTNFVPGRITRNDGGALTIATGHGEIAARGRPDRGVGEEVLTCLRPEAMRLTPVDGEPADFHQDGTDTVVRARVVESAYLGSLVDYRTEAPGGLRLRCQAAGGEPLPIGTVVELRCPAERSWVVDGDPAVAREAAA